MDAYARLSYVAAVRLLLLLSAILTALTGVGNGARAAQPVASAASVLAEASQSAAADRSVSARPMTGPAEPVVRPVPRATTALATARPRWIDRRRE